MAVFGSAEHPYYPRDLKIVGYEPATIAFTTILGVFAAGSALIFLFVWLLSGAHQLAYCSAIVQRYAFAESGRDRRLAGKKQHLSSPERVWMCWFAVTGTIHFFVEGAKHS